MREIEPHWIPIESGKPPQRGLLAVLKDVAPIVTGIGAFVLALVSFYFVRVQDREKSELTANEIRLKALAGVLEPDPAKQDVGAMGVALYGKTAIPVIRFLLRGSAKNPNMRPFGVLVVRHWIESSDSKGRADVMTELLFCARSETANLRQGGYAALAGISEVLSKHENDQVLALLEERFGAPDGPVESDPVAAQIACPLLNGYDYSAARLALRGIAKSAPDQAWQSYSTFVLKEPKACPIIANDMASVKISGNLQKKWLGLISMAQQECGK